MPDIYRATECASGSRRSSRRCRRALPALSASDEPRICLLTPGPLNETYFEHAYLARYLGFLLVEGEDLTVRDDGVFIRTVAGPEARRRAAAPPRCRFRRSARTERALAARRAGPGAGGARRQGGRSPTRSAPASSRPRAAGLPAGACRRRCSGRSLRCRTSRPGGSASRRVRDEVLSALDEMVIASAFSGDLPASRHDVGDGMTWRTLGAARSSASSCDRGPRPRLCRAGGGAALDHAGLGQRPARAAAVHPAAVSLARTADGWQRDAGRLLPDRRERRRARGQHAAGRRTADVWVAVRQAGRARRRCCRRPNAITIRRTTGTLPSRAADNLFWLGRYLERAEATLRLVRALLGRDDRDRRRGSDVERRSSPAARDWGACRTTFPTSEPALLARAALQQRDYHGSLPQLATARAHAASVIRDRLSPDAWRALDRPGRDHATRRSSSGRPKARCSTRRPRAAHHRVVLRPRAGEHERGSAAGASSNSAGASSAPSRPAASSGNSRGPRPTARSTCCSNCADSQITYRPRYLMVAARAPVLDLVVLDPGNPRSVAFQIDRIEAHLAALPSATRRPAVAAASRSRPRCDHALRTADAARDRRSN